MIVIDENYEGLTYTNYHYIYEGDLQNEDNVNIMIKGEIKMKESKWFGRN